MTIRAIADTHPVIWYIFDDPRLSSTAQTMRLVDRGQVPDLPDRISAPTAVHLGVPLISRDGKILKRFEPKVTPDSPEVTQAIEAALAAK